MPKGHKTFIYYTTLPQEGLPTFQPLSAFVAHVHERGERDRLATVGEPGGLPSGVPYGASREQEGC